jgi:hypothetical protein
MLMGGFHLFRLPAETPSVPLAHIASIPSDFVTPLESSSREQEVPVCPLQIDDIPVAILAILGPTETELKDRGKSDGLTKLIVLVQTLWFVIQCLARGKQRLPLTELEVVTLAYTMLNLFIYIFWWDKPQNVGCPIRVYKTSTAEHKKGGKQVTVWTTGRVMGLIDRIIAYFLGQQDDYVDYSQESSLPMFWAGRSEEGAGFGASVGMSLLAAGFGGIHFIAWASEFSSHAELILWRVACILLTVVPPTPWIAIAICQFSGLLDFMENAFYVLFLLFPPLYIVGRAATLVIAFTALRSLPDAALIDVDWTTFIPHV